MRHITLPPFALTISLAGLIGGCSSLEQAPLTYSSVNTMGIAVAAATPQQPGIDLTIGYKGADVAYTPVAVSKKCSDSNNDKCSEIVRIVGTSNGLSHTSSSEAADAKRHEINKLVDEQKDKRAMLAKLIAGAENVSSVCPPIALAPAPPGPPDTSTPATTTPVPISQECISARGDAATLKKDEGDIRQRIADITGQLPGLQQELGKLLLEEKTDSKSEDSYSVFGTFNGKSNGTTTGGGLQIGKTFSTGVAAQRYSEGLKRAAATVAIKQCFEAATAMLSKATDTDGAMLRQALSLCAGPTETTNQ